MKKPSKNRFEKKVEKMRFPPVWPEWPLDPRGLPKSRQTHTDILQKDTRRKPTCMCLTYVPHNSPGKFATVTSTGTRVEENSEKGDLQEWNFKKR